MAVIDKIVIKGDDYNISDSSLFDSFDVAKDYFVMDYVKYDGKLYRFNSNKTAGAWDPLKADEQSSSVYDSLNKVAVLLKNDDADNDELDFDKIETLVSAGKFVICVDAVNNKLYVLSQITDDYMIFSSVSLSNNNPEVFYLKLESDGTRIETSETIALKDHVHDVFPFVYNESEKSLKIPSSVYIGGTQQ